MEGFWQVTLKDMVEELGEAAVKEALSHFSCPLNEDVEMFLKEKAILFNRNGYAATHLVYRSYKGKPVLVGYYALANKAVSIKASTLNSKWRQRLNRYAQYDGEFKRYQIALPLIGQLGKNFANGYNKLISGDELLGIACQKIIETQSVFGGKMAYLECEDKSRLLEFYTRNGFYEFAHRNLDKDEIGHAEQRYLVQMIRYFSSKEIGR